MREIAELGLPVVPDVLHMESSHSWDYTAEEQSALYLAATILKRKQERDRPQPVKALIEWVPYHQPPTLSEEEIEEGPVPFVSETYLYALFGKEDARTLRALLRAVLPEGTVF